MKKGNLANWVDINGCKNLLFFAQLADELLDCYSIPSNRISTLNCHYLCEDAMDVISGVDAQHAPEGNMKPIMEELYSSLKRDIIFELEDLAPEKYFVKSKDGTYSAITNTAALSYFEEKKIVRALEQRYFSNNGYYYALKHWISRLITENKEEYWGKLFGLTRSLLTELVDGGYSEIYIYELVQRFFFSEDHTITSPEIIDSFFDHFDFKEKEYSVICISEGFEGFRMIEGSPIQVGDSIAPRSENPEEVDFLNRRTEKEKTMVLKCKAFDPYRASEYAKDTLARGTAILRMYKHDLRIDLESIRVGVYDAENKFIRISKRIGSVQRIKQLSKEQIEDHMSDAVIALHNFLDKNQYHEYTALRNAIMFHSISLDSIEEKNQLLDLWAIFETVLDIRNEQNTGNRIIQICNYLVPVLKRKYIYSLFSQLAMDIKNYSNTEYNRIIGDETKHFEIVRRICEFVLLDEKQDERQRFMTDCSDFPLLIERIQYYNRMLSNPSNIYSFVDKHAERVRWQIMRIYRNRNLIIHNGQSTPYLKLLVENLHSYVDDFLNYTFKCLAKGHNLESMFQDLYAKECDWKHCFERDKKTKVNPQLIETMLRQ